MNTYLLFKSLHLISIISWMAGLLYLPRIFVYHAETKEKNEEQNKTFKTMEKKLYNYIMIKLLLIAALTHYHFYLGKCVGLFASDQNVKSSKFYRIINEVPTFLLIIIIFLVVFKPL